MSFWTHLAAYITGGVVGIIFMARLNAVRRDRGSDKIVKRP